MIFNCSEGSEWEKMVNMPKGSLKNAGIGREMNKVEKSMIEMEITG